MMGMQMQELIPKISFFIRPNFERYLKYQIKLKRNRDRLLDLQEASGVSVREASAIDEYDKMRNTFGEPLRETMKAELVMKDIEEEYNSMGFSVSSSDSEQTTQGNPFEYSTNYSINSGANKK